MKNKYLKLAASMFVIALLASCATSRVEKNRIDPPHEWISQFENADEQCAELNGRFRNIGERYLGEGEVAEDAMLAEMVFGRYLPGGVVSDTVELISLDKNKQLLVKLIGESTIDHSFEVTCEYGWFVLENVRSGQYLGDGVKENRFERIARFRTGNDGELIAKVNTAAEFNSLYLFDSKATAEGWYRFLPVTRKINVSH